MSKESFYWAGFSEGELHYLDADTGFGGYGEGTTQAPALFLWKKDAKAQYEDVRKVRIVEVKS